MEEAARNMKIAQIVRQGRKGVAEGRYVEGLDARRGACTRYGKGMAKLVFVESRPGSIAVIAS